MKHKILVSLILIFAVFAFLRFYNLQNRIIFNWDQEHYAYEIKNIVQNHKLTLIGPRANNDKGFFLGPYFTYLMIPFYLLTNLHPSGSIYFLITYNLVFFVSAFLITKKIFGAKSALMFLLLWTINNLLVDYDIIPWWPLLIPLGTVLTWKLLLEKKWLLLGLVLGFFINIHFQFVFLLIYSGIFILIDKQNRNLTWKKIILTATGFFLTLLPLIFFDLRHNFLNLKLFINFFLPGGGQIKSEYFSWIPVFTNFLQPLTYWKNDIITIIFYLIFAGIVFYLQRNSKKEIKTFYLSFLILWLIVPLFFAFYGKRPSEYYYVFLYPFILLVTSNFLLKQKKIFIVLALGFLFSANFISLKFNLTKANYELLSYKDKIVREIKRTSSSKKVSIVYSVPLGWNNGFNYLLEYYGMKDEGGPKYEIVIPADQQCKFKAGTIGLKY